MKPIIGFIGLGTMGSFMSSNLARTGYPVLGFDTNVSRLDIVIDLGTTSAIETRKLAVEFSGKGAVLLEEADFPLPLTRALHQFLDVAEKRWRDSMGRPTVSFWHELTHRKASEE